MTNLKQEYAPNAGRPEVSWKFCDQQGWIAHVEDPLSLDSACHLPDRVQVNHVYAGVPRVARYYVFSASNSDRLCGDVHPGIYVTVAASERSDVETFLRANGFRWDDYPGSDEWVRA